MVLDFKLYASKKIFIILIPRTQRKFRLRDMDQLWIQWKI